MAIEIERKFLVSNKQYKSDASEQVRITQGYLNSAPERTVRVRTKGAKGYLTIKGLSSESGTSRYEWEKEIPLDEAKALLALCEPGVIDKTRYLVPLGQHTFEVDEFYGENQGLVVAEVELSHENESFGKPLWLGEEVTGQSKYYNSVLMRRPFSGWQ
ncbi:CYTH domain-containing protein [Thalassomonas haliotis]|uniref:CYTH domain-containing protein n=1 Tax=Thalassomonas haliotis TaxID=485448 RepID=A0ABY7VAL8_9GAMM|nr:CYTH domain-containing protein [Thalassomonas haliotis]WDE10618.1 CYTH domain-containing protein [Thalassomonas haliotis]